MALMTPAPERLNSHARIHNVPGLKVRYGLRKSESDFLLEPRRLTVAVSRPKRKLIVLASRALFTLMPADLDDYERGALWKHLRHACASPPLWTGKYGGYQLRVCAVQVP